jgi:hypothetical protein
MNRSTPWPFYFCAVGALALVTVTLKLWGAAQVRANVTVVLLFTFVGAVWLMLLIKLFPWLGLSLRDDFVERKNLSALVPLCGAVLALGFVYAGANIGQGAVLHKQFLLRRNRDCQFLLVVDSRRIDRQDFQIDR